VLGYHPFAEDAGIYLAGVKYNLQPANFAFNAAFITHHMQLSIFSDLIAGMVWMTHLSLDVCAFATYLLLLAASVCGAFSLSRRIFPTAAMQWAAVTTFALTLSTPVAGTALYLADPYLTGRSFITPLALFATCALLDRRWLLSLACVLGAALFHPLMAIYLAAFLISLAIAQSDQPRWLIAMPLLAILTGGVITLQQHTVAESPAYISAVLTRTYFCLSQWQWYEDLGILLPILLLAVLARLMRGRWNSAATSLALAAISAGVSVAMVSLLFVHPESHSHLLARVQVLREFLYIYCFMFLMVGAVLGHWLLQARPWRWAIYIAILSCGLFAVQRSLYPASPHLQLPGSQPSSNAWEQAFLWVRNNTPRDSVFALDPHYISAPGEDALGFRVTAERSSLADYSKDGGAAAIFPSLAEAWQLQTTAATNINNISDTERRDRLTPLGVTWIVLSRNAVTTLDCPYANSAVRVCKL